MNNYENSVNYENITPASIYAKSIGAAAMPVVEYLPGQQLLDDDYAIFVNQLTADISTRSSVAAAGIGEKAILRKLAEKYNFTPNQTDKNKLAAELRSRQYLNVTQNNSNRTMVKFDRSVELDFDIENVEKLTRTETEVNIKPRVISAAEKDIETQKLLDDLAAIPKAFPGYNKKSRKRAY